MQIISFLHQEEMFDDIDGQRIFLIEDFFHEIIYERWWQRFFCLYHCIFCSITIMLRHCFRFKCTIVGRHKSRNSKLESIPINSFVIIDTTKADYVDKDIIDVINDCLENATLKNIMVEIKKNDSNPIHTFFKIPSQTNIN